tara:strand:- start:712 stop:870 length:159 start_codon:yes stop_codon:yes gene_type:complete
LEITSLGGMFGTSAKNRKFTANELTNLASLGEETKEPRDCTKSCGSNSSSRH